MIDLTKPWGGLPVTIAKHAGRDVFGNGTPWPPLRVLEPDRLQQLIGAVLEHRSPCFAGFCATVAAVVMARRGSYTDSAIIEIFRKAMVLTSEEAEDLESKRATYQRLLSGPYALDEVCTSSFRVPDDLRAEAAGWFDCDPRGGRPLYLTVVEHRCFARNDLAFRLTWDCGVNAMPAPEPKFVPLVTTIDLTDTLGSLHKVFQVFGSRPVPRAIRWRLHPSIFERLVALDDRSGAVVYPTCGNGRISLAMHLFGIPAQEDGGLAPGEVALDFDGPQRALLVGGPLDGRLVSITGDRVEIPFLASRQTRESRSCEIGPMLITRYGVTSRTTPQGNPIYVCLDGPPGMPEGTVLAPDVACPKCGQRVLQWWSPHRSFEKEDSGLSCPKCGPVEKAGDLVPAPDVVPVHGPASELRLAPDRITALPCTLVGGCKPVKANRKPMKLYVSDSKGDEKYEEISSEAMAALGAGVGCRIGPITAEQRDRLVRDYGYTYRQIELMTDEQIRLLLAPEKPEPQCPAEVRDDIDTGGGGMAPAPEKPETWHDREPLL
jgi:hypothetical protein